MNLPTFGQLLAEYLRRSGISDSELARSIGVRRQTIFRWKEGLVERPRAREDVLQCAKKLRLSDDERDQLLLAAGFAPEQMAPRGLSEPQAASIAAAEEVPLPKVVTPPKEAESVAAEVQEAYIDAQRAAPADTLSSFAESTLAEHLAGAGSTSLESLPEETTSLAEPVAAADGAPPGLAEPAVTTLASSSTSSPFINVGRRLLTDRRWRWWPLGGVLVLVGLLGLLWTREALFWTPATPTPLPPATVVLHPPPQTTPTNLPTAPLAAEGESLLLVAQFTGYTTNERYNVAGRISEEVEQQITAAQLVSTTVMVWPDEIPNAQRASQLLAAANATMVIWGEYDSGRVRVNLEARDPKASQQREFTLTSADELVTTINSTVPNEIRLVALMALGRLLRDQKAYTAAAAVFQRALQLNPEDQGAKATLNFYLGYVAEQSSALRDLNHAIVYYTRAIELNERLYIAYYNRGTVQLKRYALQPPDEGLLVETLDAAIADLSTMIAKQPTYADAYLNRGVAYYERDGPDDMTAALRDLSYVIALKADDAHAYYLRGLVQIRAGAETEWITDFQQALTLQPDHVGAISGLCWGYALAQQAETALPYCDQAVDLDTTGASRDSRGIAYAQLGRYDEAVADFRAYLDVLQTAEPATLYERYRGPLIEQWITQLEAGENPFESALLEKLRHRDPYSQLGD